jgi:RNA polymerase sigma-70 factor, ECF subfamily
MSTVLDRPWNLSSRMTEATPISVSEDQDPVSALLERESEALRRVIGRYVRHGHAVDEIFQEVSLKVLRRIDSVRDPLALRGWLFQLARNAALDWLRAQDRRPGGPSETLDTHRAAGDLGRNPIEHLMTTERVAAIRRALDDLPSSQREVIRLRIDDGLDHEAIASRLGISRQAVEVRLCRGRAALKERLDAILSGDL